MYGKGVTSCDQDVSEFMYIALGFDVIGVLGGLVFETSWIFGQLMRDCKSGLVES